MNKKFICFTLILIFFSNLLFAANTDLLIYNQPILPSNEKIGEITFGNINSVESNMIKIFQQEYNLDWIEKNVKADYRYNFTQENSKIMLSLLPIKTTMYCSKIKNYSNNKAVSIFISNDKIIDILLDIETDKIISISFNRYSF
jgi:hypothetical protein